MENTMDINIIANNLIEFYAHMITADEFFKKSKIEQTELKEHVLQCSAREWEVLPCDNEGETTEQKQLLDKHINQTISNLIR